MQDLMPRNMRFPSICLALGTAALSLLISGQQRTAYASPYTFPTFSAVAHDSDDIGSMALTGAPSGTVFTSYTVSFDWSPGDNEPFSEEAIWSLASDVPGAATPPVFYADPGRAPNSAGDGTPVTLTWNSYFDTPYVGGDPVYFWFSQTFPGSTAGWSNISVTIDTNLPPPPPSTHVDALSTTTFSLMDGDISWFDLDYVGGELSIDTIGSLLTPDNDTEIALYNSVGRLIDTNDDIDSAGGDRLSRLHFAEGDLATGKYYIAVGGFDSTFANNFFATSASGNTGTLQLNLQGVSAATVPEAGSLSLLVLAGGMSLLGAVAVTYQRTYRRETQRDERT